MLGQLKLTHGHISSEHAIRQPLAIVVVGKVTTTGDEHVWQRIKLSNCVFRGRASSNTRVGSGTVDFRWVDDDAVREEIDVSTVLV